MGAGDPARPFESRAGQRLDCLHRGQRPRSRASRRLVRRVGSVNAGVVRGIRPFDPFPFPFLTMTVSLEAIFLALFVLASQNRLARQADKRSHLDLQIDLLAEREMTAVLQLLQDIARHLDVQTTLTPEQLRDLMKKTDVRRLTDRMEELAEPATATAADGCVLGANHLHRSRVTAARPSCGPAPPYGSVRQLDNPPVKRHQDRSHRVRYWRCRCYRRGCRPKGRPHWPPWILPRHER